MISAIMAVDERGGIGKDSGLPWPTIKEDMQWFREKTLGQLVVMGRKTWQSLGKNAPLSDRLNVVVTSKPLSAVPGAVGTLYGDNLCQAIKSFEKSYDDREIVVIGGAEIYTQLFPVCEKLYITRIPGVYECDTYLDLDPVLKDYRLIEIREMKTCIAETWEKK